MMLIVTVMMLATSVVQGLQLTEPNVAVSRRGWMQQVVVGSAATVAAGSLLTPSNSWAFDGSGSSAYAGKSPSSKLALRKSYQDRLIADMRDFNRLGAAIAAGETEGGAWVNFFIPFARKEPDSLGRAYAALADFRGVPTPDPKVFEGGCGMLLASSFTKAGKPPDNTPAVKSFTKVYRNFDAIQAAGKKGDLAKAKIEYEKTKTLLVQYLTDVELPGDLSDPVYK